MLALLNFNPRPPRGGRRIRSGSRGGENRYFNPRPPRGGRLALYNPRMLATRFQPTSPARGTTPMRRAGSHSETRFQPTSPARGTTAYVRAGIALDGISTHVPREGDDVKGNPFPFLAAGFQPTSPARGTTFARQAFRLELFQFQPTSPARGTTLCATARYIPSGISTHVPREGDDSGSYTLLSCRAAFQPTSPARGTTLPRGSNYSDRQYFNPRPPRGGRLALGMLRLAETAISTHVPREGDDIRAIGLG